MDRLGLRLDCMDDYGQYSDDKWTLLDNTSPNQWRNGQYLDSVDNYGQYSDNIWIGFDIRRPSMSIFRPYNHVQIVSKKVRYSTRVYRTGLY